MRNEITEEVYDVIKNASGKVTTKELDKLFGSKTKVRQALTRLTVQGRIMRFKSLDGDEARVVYRYKVTGVQAPRQQNCQ